jgi:alkanesulfonate monooxygenase SsuD/methylene tetrahydromethanopterin reductase-like flavin-dependent oxidoreductase (luciferase family)
MPVEFIGMISTQDQSETRPSSGPVIDKDYVRRFARAHEDAGFDRVLSLAETAEQIASVRAAAGRPEPPRISVSFRPILGATEELAWERAHRILAAMPSAGNEPSRSCSAARAAGAAVTSGR